MTYELAKELKDAGYPQDGDFAFTPVKDEKQVNAGEGEWVRLYVGGNNMAPRGDYVYCPTLSELIEACGDQFFELNKIPDETQYDCWNAHGWKHRVLRYNSDFEITEGSTPEEAVARLWLALHPKS